jgi:ketosteroid isomerase-like protein
MAATAANFLMNRTAKSIPALAIAAWLAFGGAALAQPTCSDPLSKAFMPARVTNPEPGDRQAIMDLIHSYNWALDDKDAAAFAELFTEDATYEACSVGVQIFKTTGKDPLGMYIQGVLQGLPFQTRHFESNTLLHAKDRATVDGKWMLLVTIQRPDVETPALDYTAVVKATFIRDKDNLWRIAKLTLITDEPQIKARAR